MLAKQSLVTELSNHFSKLEKNNVLFVLSWRLSDNVLPPLMNLALVQVMIWPNVLLINLDKNRKNKLRKAICTLYTRKFGGK